MMKKIKLFTIGFTKKSAEKFFTMLNKKGVKRVIDVRLNNVSQLAGFAKRDDLCYFLKTICKIDYIHIPDLAPTKDILNEYKKNNGDWSVYEKKFLNLMSENKVEDKMSGKILDRDCLLCSEDEPIHCHRRLVAEYLRDKWSNVEIEHIKG
ncbi:MAG: DUF488 domain-containing protein [Desulfobacteraceae bacterium]|nr:DUF488 domain-containing protein [Desulfobacteraceae bacterium]